MTPVDPARPVRRLALLGAGFLLVAAVVAPLAVLVRGRWRPLVDLDAATVGSARAHGALHTLAGVVTWLGVPGLLEATGVVVALWLLRAGRGRSALYLAVAIGGGQLLSLVTKAVVHRTRPCALAAPVQHCPAGYSFPSGHAIAASAGYLALAVVVVPMLAGRLRRLAVGVALVVPLLVAASRVVLGVHYLSDVLAGLALGWGWVAMCTAVFTRWRAEEGRPVHPLTEGVDPVPAS